MIQRGDEPLEVEVLAKGGERRAAGRQRNGRLGSTGGEFGGGDILQPGPRPGRMMNQVGRLPFRGRGAGSAGRRHDFGQDKIFAGKVFGQSRRNGVIQIGRGQLDGFGPEAQVFGGQRNFLVPETGRLSRLLDGRAELAPRSLRRHGQMVITGDERQAGQAAVFRRGGGLGRRVAGKKHLPSDNCGLL